MCGRYDLDVTALELAARFGLQLREALRDGSAGVTAGAAVGWRPRYNIAPGQRNPVVVRDGSGHNQLELMQWGLVPAWSREAKVAYSTINARAETVASKPTFRKPLATQRCLVPATGYYEWVEGAQSMQGAKAGTANVNLASKVKQPYRIVLRSESEGKDEVDGIFAFAGLYDIWQGPGGEELQTYAIVTTRANDALSAIHSRMPVILPSDVEGAWLDQDYKDTEKLISLLQPYREEGMTAYPVSRLVNSPANDRRELIEPMSRLAA
jgi:putative SOS response-associated peptidase YedK